ncbi:MAG: hypothetical protein HKM07_04285 [Chlamydiae bacterium]|nr:hypothetical protein [Chlamydiota bacterium]
MTAAARDVSASSGSSIWALPSWSISDLKETGIKAVFQIASYLTDPVCKSHELFRRAYLVDTLHPEAYAASNYGRKIFLSLGVVATATVATLTTAPGIILRSLAARFQDRPFLYYKGQAEEKVMKDDQFSHLSWNVCFVCGGYSISDGGVTPWPERIEAVTDQIYAEDADVVCLYEVFDTKSGLQLYEKLKDNYAHFYFNIGPKAVGVSSGIFVASKYKIVDPEFSAFPQEALVGRTKHAAKGVFDFSIQSQGRNFSRIFATHLQHSEQCDFPTAEEVAARKMELDIIMKRIDAVRDKSLALVLTGDLNLDEKELAAFPWSAHFIRDTSLVGKPTWGGDGFCATMVGKKVSPPLTLDYTLVKKGTAQEIFSSLVETDFDGKVYRESALSDHSGIKSSIEVV